MGEKGGMDNEYVDLIKDIMNLGLKNNIKTSQIMLKI